MNLPGLSAYTEQQQEQIGLEVMAESFRVLENVGRKLDGWTMMDATSRIAEDNAASSLHRQMSQELHYLMSSALDHLNLVHKLWTNGEVPPFAPFTLIRSSIESSAYGVWIQQPGTVDARPIRLLELQWDQRRNVDTYTAAAGAHTPALTEWLWAVLNDTKNRRSRLKQRNIKPLPRITDILLQTDRVVARKSGIGGLAAWRIGSGVTHGNQNFALGLMNRRSIPLADGTEGSEHTVSTLRLAMVLMPAVDYLAKLMAMILDNSVPQPGRPAPVPITGGPPPPTIPGLNA